MKNKLLPEFQEFLRSRRLVNEKYIPFYAYWASKFLSFSNKSVIPNHELQVKEFLNKLKSQDNVADWQVRQAENALKLYSNHYLGSDKSVLHPDISNRRKKIPNISEIIDKLRGALRLMEAARLRVKDIDFGSDLIFARAGKGDKDRTTVLPETLKNPLKRPELFFNGCEQPVKCFGIQC